MKQSEAEKAAKAEEAETLEAAGAGVPSQAQRERLASATRYAIEWHRDQLRKSTRIPYVSHLLQVAGLVLEHGGDIDQCVAALLHDALEDAETSEERTVREETIAGEFGDGVVRIVVDCSDTGADETLAAKKPWRERKSRFLGQLDGIDVRSLLVVACDKRHNLHALVWDVRMQGCSYLDAFNAGAEEQLWYFESLRAGFDGRIPERLGREFAALVDEFRDLIC